jgi:two-component system LytT family response regulator
MLKAVIIDDEKLWLELLSNLLSRHCPSVEVAARCSSAAEGIEAIHNHHPDVVFTDIEMPGMNGFEMLKQFVKTDFDIVFITAYDQYAVKAFQCSALDYLMKPIKPEELKEAIRKVEQKKINSASSDQLELFFSAFNSKMRAVKKIALPTTESIIFVSPENIIRCESDSNYTLFIMEDSKKYLCRKH